MADKKQTNLERGGTCAAAAAAAGITLTTTTTRCLEIDKTRISFSYIPMV